MKWYKLFDTESKLRNALGEAGRKIVRIGDKRVCLFLHENTYHAFDNLCPHNMHSLFEGKVNYLSEIVCPLHGYRYNLLDGRECEGKSGDLIIHKLEVRTEGVFLGLNN
jgi:nitrite reductase/ring-hydroxylating ferredoxin subunit